MSAGDVEQQEAAAPSEWTRVTRKGKRNKSQRQAKSADAGLPPPPPPVAGAPENFQPNSAPQLSVQEIRADHDTIAAKWRGTAGYAQLCEVVKKNASSHAPITRAICLGLGAFDPQDGSWLAQRRSHVQMAAFLAIVDILSQRDGGDIECYYQEPRFAQPDKDFIASLQGKVVESPGSYELVDENTLVFGVHLYRDIWADALRRSLPGMFVGTGWDVWEQTPEAERSCDFERIKEMDTSFDKFRFPQDEHSSFSSTCIYWKKRSLDDDSNTASRETKDDPDKLDNTSSSEAITEESKDCAT